jgi:DNA invertase Pin-like site-specific DNA recombinase
MKPTITAAIYARVSTLDQQHDMQRHELNEYCARMGWNVIEYSEKASSVKKRPELDRLMRDAQQRKFDVVLVWRMDRFARSLPQLLENIRALDAAGVRFVCPSQGIDTDHKNPAARLMMQMLGAFAEFERAIIVERVRAGVAEAQRKGTHCGRPRKIFRRDEALEMRARGMSYGRIAAELGLKKATLVSALKAAA